MAVYPCDWTPHRYPDPQRSIYVTWSSGALLQTSKLRLCPKHFTECGEVVAKYLAMVDDSSAISQVCEECGKPKEAAVYAKVFDEKAPPDSWAGDFCAECAEKVLDELRTSTGQPMSTRTAN